MNEPADLAALRRENTALRAALVAIVGNRHVRRVLPDRLRIEAMIALNTPKGDHHADR